MFTKAPAILTKLTQNRATAATIASIVKRGGSNSHARLSSTLAKCSIAAVTASTSPLAVTSTMTCRLFSDDASHGDFAPKRKAAVPTETEEAINMIKDHVTQNKVMLYMKGNPSMPMCGFSARVVQVLQKEGIDFASVNVLDYPSIREGVKQYAKWPTIPQLYVNGEFVGGCDIIMSMHENGELKELLQEVVGSEQK